MGREFMADLSAVDACDPFTLLGLVHSARWRRSGDREPAQIFALIHGLALVVMDIAATARREANGLPMRGSRRER